MSNILLGVTGGIAAYKAADLAGALLKNDHSVVIIMTEAAKKFITPLTLSTMSRNRIMDDDAEWTPDGEIKHIELAKWADLFVVAPATANTIAKLANGIADNLLTSVFLALPKDKPTILCPAMNTRMWEDPITVENLKKLDTIKMEQKKNISTVPPEEGLLACGDYGMGKFPSVKTIVEKVNSILKVAV